jgi:4-hydroxybenzoyl-CoA reductase subunit beta
MKLPHFTHHAPASVQECTEILAAAKPEAQIIAGGSDLLVRMKLGLTSPDCLISLSKITALKQIDYSPERGLTIGAGVTLAGLTENPVVREKCPAITNAAELVATRQIRTVATLGGNVSQNTRCQYYNRSTEWGKAVDPCFKRGGKLCHIMPRGKRCFAVYQGDLAPLLIALNATATIVSQNQAREVSLGYLFSNDGVEPFTGVDGKLITQFTIPESSLDSQSDYKKYRLRNGIDFPLAGVAVALKSNHGLIEDLQVCLTGVSSSPVLVSIAGETVEGKQLNHALIQEISKLVYDTAHPLANLEGDPARRRTMIRIMTEDILTSFIH